MSTEPKSEAEIELDVINLVSEQKKLQEEEHELMQNPRFAKFLQAQKKFEQQSELFWETIKNEMIKHDIKKISGDWGYVTLAKKTGFSVDVNSLPPRFIKKVPDIKKIGDRFKLEGKLPPGVELEPVRYITKKIK